MSRYIEPTQSDRDRVRALLNRLRVVPHRVQCEVCGDVEPVSRPYLPHSHIDQCPHLR